MNYVFMTDSDSDLPYELKVKYDIPVIYMPYAMNGKEYFDDLGQTIDHKSYFDAMRNGAVPVTAALNEVAYTEYFEPILKEGKDILFAAFSSKLSRTLEGARAAVEELLPKYPGRRVVIVDTLAISAPLTLLVLRAHELYRNGADLDTVADWLEKNKLRSHAFFTVDDLKYLKRGGRVSAAAAAVGTMLDLKPVLVETKEGKLEAVAKVRGRRKAIAYLVEQGLANFDGSDDGEQIVLHADCLADAEKLRDALLEKKPDMKLTIMNVGPVIGAHAGPGTLAFCFMGKERPY